MAKALVFFAGAEDLEAREAIGLSFLLLDFKFVMAPLFERFLTISY